jgi:hypothetical protein
VYLITTSRGLFAYLSGGKKLSLPSEMTYLTNVGHGPLKVPGFGGIPLDFELPPESRFAHGLVDYRHSPRLTKREMAMLRLMQHITETPGWHRLVLDPDE